MPNVSSTLKAQFQKAFSMNKHNIFASIPLPLQDETDQLQKQLSTKIKVAFHRIPGDLDSPVYEKEFKTFTRSMTKPILTGVKNLKNILNKPPQ